MARSFSRPSTQYLRNTNAIVTAYPFTMACWFYPSQINQAYDLIWIGDDASNNERWVLSATGNVAGDPVQFTSRDGGNNRNASTTTGFSQDTWHHACGVGVSATDRSVFIDGGSEGANTTSSTPSGLDSTEIGRRGGTSDTNYMNGRIAEAAIWDTDLDNAQVAILAAGYSPLFVQPQNLVAYWRLIRDEDTDIVGGYNMTAFNTPTVDTHPPIIYPAPPYPIVPGAATATILPQMMQQYYGVYG